MGKKSKSQNAGDTLRSLRQENRTLKRKLGGLDNLKRKLAAATAEKKEQCRRFAQLEADCRAAHADAEKLQDALNESKKQCEEHATQVSNLRDSLGRENEEYSKQVLFVQKKQAALISAMERLHEEKEKTTELKSQELKLNANLNRVSYELRTSHDAQRRSDSIIGELRAVIASLERAAARSDRSTSQAPPNQNSNHGQVGGTMNYFAGHFTGRQDNRVLNGSEDAVRAMQDLDDGANRENQIEESVASGTESGGN